MLVTNLEVKQLKKYFICDLELYFSQSWCANIREQVAIVRLDSDSHSPDKFRYEFKMKFFNLFALQFFKS